MSDPTREADARAALREIIARTYSSDRRCKLGYESVAEICDIAQAALQPDKLNPDAFESAWFAFQNTPIDFCNDSDDEARRCLRAAIEAYLQKVRT